MPRPKKSHRVSTNVVDQKWFAERIEGVGLSQRGAARELGLDHASLSRALDGSRKLQVQEAIDLARIFRVPLREVLKRAGFDVSGVS